MCIATCSVLCVIAIKHYQNEKWLYCNLPICDCCPFWQSISKLHKTGWWCQFWEQQPLEETPYIFVPHCGWSHPRYRNIMQYIWVSTLVVECSMFFLCECDDTYVYIHTYTYIYIYNTNNYILFKEGSQHLLVTQWQYLHVLTPSHQDHSSWCLNHGTHWHGFRQPHTKHGKPQGTNANIPPLWFTFWFSEQVLYQTHHCWWWTFQNPLSVSD